MTTSGERRPPLTWSEIVARAQEQWSTFRRTMQENAARQRGELPTVGFYLWPAEGEWEPSMYRLFRLLPRIEMEMSEADWSAFSSSLERQGITLREVEHSGGEA